MTLDDLRADVRSKADEESTGFITNTEVDRFINQGYNLVYSKITQRFEDYFITKSSPASTVADQEGYSLPSGTIKLVKVEWRPSTSSSPRDWRRVDKTSINNTQRWDASVRGIWTYSNGASPYKYFLAGNSIYFDPCPNEVFSYRFWTVNTPTRLSAGSDEPVIPEIYHPCISEFGAIHCLRKSGETLFKESMELWALELQNLLDTVDIRDVQPETMTINDDDFEFERTAYSLP